MKIGFTGTRQQPTEAQVVALANLLVDLRRKFNVSWEAHHGDCVGADNPFATMFAEGDYGRIVVHPPADNSLRAFNPYRSVCHPAKSYHARNRDIVDAADMLIAMPREDRPADRGGTWYTVGYARKMEKPVYIIWPGGEVMVPEAMAELWRWRGKSV